MSVAETSRLLILFARRPFPGRVKTRLCPPLRPEEAAALQAAFVADCFAVARSMAEADPRLRIEIHWDSPESGPVPFEPPWYVRNGDGVCGIDPPAGRVQEGEGLGSRIAHAFGRAFEGSGTPPGAVLLRNTDSPELPASLLELGLELLESPTGPDVVFGPDPGGGYTCVGLRRDRPGLFLDLPLGGHAEGSGILARSLERCTELGLVAGVLPEAPDCDLPADLHALEQRLRKDPGRAPKTAALLARWREEGWERPDPGPS